MKRLFFLVSLSALLTVSCTGGSGKDGFAHVENGQFIVNGEPYRFVGVNFWCAAVLGSEGRGGDRERLSRELDAMKELGITNLRVLVGADGPLDTLSTAFSNVADASGNAVFGQVVRSSVVQPTLQIAPGVYNEELLDGLDWFMAELGKRGMMAVLYLNNTWSWSGGYGQYLRWAHPDSRRINTGAYYTDHKADSLFRNHVRFILGRTNRYTGLKYTEDPAIFSWQLGNEPRPLGRGNKTAFVEWISGTAALIRSLDSNHMISTGNEGEMGSDNDWELVDAINSIPDISYMTIHIWPFNWSWIHAGSVEADVENAMEQTAKYIDAHSALATDFSKPMVIEEFGYPRDGFRFKTGTPTSARDRYFSFIFERMVEAKAQKAPLAGCNIWAWGGLAETPEDHDYWYVGDDYTGDPAMEQQGLNSVFLSDKSTVELIKETNQSLR